MELLLDAYALSSQLTYADGCWRMLTQAEHVELMLDAYTLEFHALTSQLTDADVC